MKRFVFALLSAAMILASAGALRAQEGSEMADLEITRGDIQADRKALVAANLELTDEQGTAFWPLYRDYRAEIDKVNDGLLGLVNDYAKSDETLNDEQATTLVKRFLELQSNTGEVRRKYVGRFGKILPGKSVMRFYQIENKLDAIVMASLVDAIPLARQ